MRQWSVILGVMGVCCGLGLSVQGAEVACTTTLIGDIVSQIAGDDIQVFVLLPPDADPHAYEPRPQDLVALDRADLVFINGLGLEAGLISLLEAVDTPVVTLSDSLSNLVVGGGDPNHPQDGYDPHVWFDPTLVSEWVDGIAGQLTALSPSLEPVFRARAIAYQQELAALDVWIRDAVETIPPDRRQLVTDHHVLGYFVRRYGFEQVGSVIPGVSSLAEPSARDLSELIASIETLGVPAVFVGTTINPALAQQIAADTGTQLVFLYTGALSASSGPAATYLSFMRYDVSAIVEALGKDS